MKIGKYIVGLISGATFGVLFAPKKGKKLRTEILNKGDKSGHEAVSALVDAFKEAGMEVFEEMKKLSENEKMGQAIGSSKKAMQKYLEQLETTGQDIASKAKDHLDDLVDLTDETSKKIKKTVKKAKKTVSAAQKKVEKKAAKKPASKKKVASKSAKTSTAKKPAAKKVVSKKTSTKKKAVKKVTTKKVTPKKTASKTKKTSTKK